MQKIKRTLNFILDHPFAKRHFLRSAFRFVYWQFQTSIKPGRYIKKPFIGPVKFYARKGLAGVTGNLYTGLHEFNEMGFLLHLLRENETFFDVGANIGSYTLLASGYIKANSVAIEPIPSTYKLLSDNIALNKLHNKVKLVNAGAGDADGLLTFTAGEDTTNHVVMEGEHPAETVNVAIVKIDDLVTDAPVLIKMDVEGFESRALNGMPLLLRNSGFKALIIEMSNAMLYGYNDEYTRSLLASHGFKPFVYDALKRQLIPITNLEIENIIYCRDLDFVNERLKSAPAVRLMGDSF